MSFELIIMADLENLSTPYTKNAIASNNSNIKTPSSQKFKLVTRFCKKQDLVIQDVYLLFQKQTQRFVEKFNKVQYLACLQVCFKIYHYRPTVFEKSSLLDIWHSKFWLNPFLIASSTKLIKSVHSVLLLLRDLSTWNLSLKNPAGLKNLLTIINKFWLKSNRLKPKSER